MPAIVIGYGHVTFIPVGMMYMWHGLRVGSMTRGFVYFQLFVFIDFLILVVQFILRLFASVRTEINYPDVVE